MKTDFTLQGPYVCKMENTLFDFSFTIENEQFRVKNKELPYNHTVSLLAGMVFLEIYKRYQPSTSFFLKDRFDDYYTPVFEDMIITFLMNFMDVKGRVSAKNILLASAIKADYDILYGDVMMETISNINSAGGIFS